MSLKEGFGVGFRGVVGDGLPVEHEGKGEGGVEGGGVGTSKGTGKSIRKLLSKLPFSNLPFSSPQYQRKIKRQQRKGKIVSEFFTFFTLVAPF